MNGCVFKQNRLSFLAGVSVERENAPAEGAPAPTLVPSSTNRKNMHNEQKVGTWLNPLDENTNGLSRRIQVQSCGDLSSKMSIKTCRSTGHSLG
jgi:hypothetical protein